jgi:hypothetical protein
MHLIHCVLVFDLVLLYTSVRDKICFCLSSARCLQPMPTFWNIIFKVCQQTLYYRCLYSNRKGYSTIDNIFVLHVLIELYFSFVKKLFCTFIDFRKAFVLNTRFNTLVHIKYYFKTLSFIITKLKFFPQVRSTDRIKSLPKVYEGTI